MIISIKFIYKFICYLFINLINVKCTFFILLMAFLQKVSFCNFIRNNPGLFSACWRKKIVIAVVPLIIISCSSILKKEYPQKKYFIINPNYEKAAESLFKTNNIKVTKVKISPFFEGKNFVYRQGENSYESDYYNEFLVFPAYNLNESISKWFSKSNPSETPSFEFQDSTYLLAVIIESMYVDFRDEKNPKTKWEISFTLQKSNDQNLVFKKDYIIETTIEKITPENVIKSWNYGLSEILVQLQADLFTISNKVETETEKSSKVLQKKKKKR
jgi:cholesterol transport system auxiliary component